MKKKLMMLLACLFFGLSVAIAQTQKITGVVISEEDGEPIIGASVFVKGHNTIGTITDVDGNFTLTGVPASAKFLTVSYVGFATQDVAIKPILKIILKSDSQLIDDVVVVAYGTAKKESLVGAQASISSKSLAKRPLTNVSNALAGAAPGVQAITSTGQPGSSAAIRIRGFGSVNASSAPLYVVDGAIYNGNISDIPTQDIQSLSILKDAASTSLYGSSAGNGVILITTKSGSNANVGKPNFNFSMSQGFTRRGQEDYEKIGAMQYYPVLWQQWFNQYRYTNGLTAESAAGYAMNELLTDAVYQPYAGVTSVYQYDATTKGFKYLDASTNPSLEVPAIVLPDGTLNPQVTGLLWGDDLDWEKALFRTGYRSDYSLSGGLNTDKLKSYISLGYMKEEGYRIETGYERFSARANLSYDVNNWLKVGTNTSFTRSESEAPKQASGSFSSNSFNFVRGIAPIYPIHMHNADGSYVLDSAGNKIYDHSDLRPYSGRFNPVEESYLDKSVSETDALNSRTFATIQFMKDLKLTTNLSYDLLNSRSKVRFNNEMGDQPLGMLEIKNYRYTTVTFNQLLNYAKSFDKHNFEFLLGHENYSYKVQSLIGEKKGMFLLGLDEFSNLSEITELKSGTDTYKKEGYFGRINYDYDGKYNASFSYRRDGSSRFHKDKRWGNFWSMGLGWNIHREKFMEKLSWIDELKVRASIGQTGVDGLSSYYPYKTLYGLGNNNYTNIGLRMSLLGNRNLVWETQTSTDIAVEFGLFRRLRGTIEFFNKASKDLVFDRPLPASSGIGSIADNIGKVRNYGIEFSLEGTLLQTNDINWVVKANGTITRNKIVELPEANRADGIEFDYHKYVEGGSVYDYYLNEFIGVNPKNGKAMYRLDKVKYPNAETVGTDGEEATWTYRSDFAQKHFCGSSIPDLYGGFGTDFSWKDIDFSVSFAYQLGGKSYDGGYQSLMGRRLKAGRAFHVDMLKAWRQPDDVTDVPRLDAGTDGQYDNTNSDRFLISSSALMLRSISIGYTLPKAWTNKLQLGTTRISLAGENLFLLSKRKGLNPMGQYSGVTGSAYYDYAKTITATLSVSL